MKFGSRILYENPDNIEKVINSLNLDLLWKVDCYSWRMVTKNGRVKTNKRRGSKERRRRVRTRSRILEKEKRKKAETQEG